MYAARMPITAISIRLTDEEKQEALAKGEELGIRTLAGVIRYAIKKLRVQPSVRPSES
jgi:hypothetical protein